MKILHIEDDATLSMLIKKILKEHQYVVVKTKDETFEKLQSETFDLVIMDGKLSDGNFGGNVIKEMRAKNFTLPIVACSAAYNDELLKAGADAEMHKVQSSREAPAHLIWKIDHWNELFKKLGL